MARLIPNTVSNASNSSNAERELLDALSRENSISKEWIVLHSLDLRWHINKLQGEVDFLALIPGEGILAVEVKGCDVTRSGGIWTYHYGMPKSTSEGPFRQASSAMFSFRSWAQRNGLMIDKIMTHSCAVFTEFDFNEVSVEWNPWQAIGRTSIRSNGIAICLLESIRSERRYVAGRKAQGLPSASWYSESASRPTIPQIEGLAARLRRDFHYAGRELADIERLEAAIQDATDEQTEVAWGALGNSRLLVKGAAGTGKTFVAVKMAKFWADKGLRVGMLCFNKLLGKWLTSELPTLSSSGYAGNLASLLLKVTSMQIPKDASDEFWIGMTGGALNWMITNNQKPIFDVLVIDEAQDLMHEDTLDAMDILLEGGLKGGRWIFAGDFSRQAIYTSGAGEIELLARLGRRGIVQGEFTLSSNCRNAQRVATNVSLLGGLRPAYRSTLRSNIPGDVRPYFVSDQSAKLHKLREILSDLQSRYSPEDIVVLSPQAASLAKALRDQDPAIGLCAMTSPLSGGGKLRFCTVHAFKGLDAQVVVITDIDRWDSTLEEVLFYIAISRARHEAHIILDSKLQATYQKKVMNG